LKAGNVEAWPFEPDYDTFTTVDLTPPSSAAGDLPPYSGETFDISWIGWGATSGVTDYDVRVSVARETGSGLLPICTSCRADC